MNEPLTPEDWRRLADLCLDRARGYDETISHLVVIDQINQCYELKQDYLTLASKCAEREAALRAGQVLP